MGTRELFDPYREIGMICIASLIRPIMCKEYEDRTPANPLIAELRHTISTRCDGLI
jgi:hypothetical protein